MGNVEVAGSRRPRTTAVYVMQSGRDRIVKLKVHIVRCLHVQMYIRQFYAYMYSKSLAQSLLLLLFFLYRCCIAASPPPKVAFPRKTGNVVVSPPPTGGGGGGLPYSRLPSSFLQSRLSPQGFFVQILEKKIMESQSMLKSIFCTSQGY